MTFFLRQSSLTTHHWLWTWPGSRSLWTSSAGVWKPWEPQRCKGHIDNTDDSPHIVWCLFWNYEDWILTIDDIVDLGCRSLYLQFSWWYGRTFLQQVGRTMFFFDMYHARKWKTAHCILQYIAHVKFNSIGIDIIIYVSTPNIYTACVSFAFRTPTQPLRLLRCSQAKPKPPECFGLQSLLQLD